MKSHSCATFATRPLLTNPIYVLIFRPTPTQNLLSACDATKPLHSSPIYTSTRNPPAWKWRKIITLIFLKTIATYLKEAIFLLKTATISSITTRKSEENRQVAQQVKSLTRHPYRLLLVRIITLLLDSSCCWRFPKPVRLQLLIVRKTRNYLSLLNHPTQLFQFKVTKFYQEWYRCRFWYQTRNIEF